MQIIKCLWDGRWHYLKTGKKVGETDDFLGAGLKIVLRKKEVGYLQRFVSVGPTTRVIVSPLFAQGRRRAAERVVVPGKQWHDSKILDIRSFGNDAHRIRNLCQLPEFFYGILRVRSYGPKIMIARDVEYVLKPFEESLKNLLRLLDGVRQIAREDQNIILKVDG